MLTWGWREWWRGVRAVWRLGLTWRYERTTRVTKGDRRVTWRDGMLVLQVAHPTSYGGDFCASECSKVRPFEWWWRCSKWRLVPKIPMKAPSLLAMYSTFDSSGYTGILAVATDQYQRWLRQRKNTRKDKDCTKHIEQWLWYHVRIVNNSLYIEVYCTM